MLHQRRAKRSPHWLLCFAIICQSHRHHRQPRLCFRLQQIRPNTIRSTQSTLAAAAFESCLEDIEALEHASAGLRDIISQVQVGQVQRIRAYYGPQPERKTNPHWMKIKVAVTKTDRLYEKVFRDQFMQGENRFFRFFRVPPEDAPKRKSRTSLTTELSCSSAHQHPGLLRPVVEAIPQCQADITEEQSRSQYRDQTDGQFSEAAWKQKWGSMNHWEV